MKIEVLDTGKHHIVVNKPYNMVVVAGRGAPRPTLLDLAQEEFGKGMRPVHRLDRVTTGCCIFAKGLYGQQALSNAFRKRLVHKQYLAIIEGTPSFKSINIDARLKRVDNLNAKKGYLSEQTIDEKDGQRALTRVQVLATSDKYTLIKANPETGRMHQIRVHLAHVGHPIVGDKQYGAETAFQEKAIGLFAWKIAFPLPEGGRREAKAPLPKEWQKFLAKYSLKTNIDL